MHSLISPPPCAVRTIRTRPSRPPGKAYFSALVSASPAMSPSGIMP
jgi:hypothetical protein